MILTRVTLVWFVTPWSLHANCCTYVRFYSRKTGTCFLTFSKVFSTRIDHNLDFDKFNLKPIFTPSSLLCFPTSGMVSQYISHFIRIMKISRKNMRFLVYFAEINFQMKKILRKFHLNVEKILGSFWEIIE